MNREDFPMIAVADSMKADCCLDPRDNGDREGWIYFDNAATMQKPRQVLKAVDEFYRRAYASPLRGLYDLSVAVTEEVRRAREKVAEFISADLPEEIIFTSGATEGLNMAAMWCAGLTSDDEIIVSRGEHHSNLLPWLRIAEATGAHLKMVDCRPDGTVDEVDYLKALTPNTKVVAVNLVGNVLGGKNCIKNLFKQAHNRGEVLCVLDAAQAVAHMKIDVRELNADIMVFSGHKMGAPMGIGVLYGKKKVLERVSPVQMGGEMVEQVSLEKKGLMVKFAEAPEKFEAGTQNVGGIIGLAAAIDYLTGVGFDKIASYERDLLDYATERLGEVAEIYGAGNGIVAFNITGIHPHDTAQFLSGEGIAVRAGWHCAQPLLEWLKIGPVVRMSLSFYNTREEIDKMAKILTRLKQEMSNV
ncbi:aminotransferase class V-fold PLP-dependent enzyme [Candidatus Saccharibacteria bacterium]|nr:aminotransferase class V-fold PLP-dependent enzyme [Candidatus Saccharibacteria bacterium]